MINFLWMLYIALMLFATVSTIIDIVDVRASDNKYIFNDKDYFIPGIVITCLLWASFIVYYLN